jgi:outer membrane protein assembly factor BamD (BamD/ComL family)
MMLRLPLVVVVVILALGAAPRAQQAVNEDLARRQYESGLTFMQNQRYTEALKDFQAIIDSFPQSQVADNALLQIALYRLEVAKDLAATQAAVDQLLKQYPDSDSAPMAHVVGGRVSMAKGRTPSDVDAALASFERVERLFPGNEAVPAAGYFAGETLRLARRHDEALDRYRRVTAAYPNSPWAARANLGAGYCLVQNDRALAAFPDVQRVRQMMAQTPVAADALNLNTILYRLYVRAPGQPAYAYSGRAIGSERANYDDVIGLAFDLQSRLLLGHKNGIAMFDAKGGAAGAIGSSNPSAFFVDPSGKIFVARENLLISEKVETTAVTIPQPGKPEPRRVEEIPSAVALSTGHRIVVDKKERDVIRLDAGGQYLGPFAPGVNTERLAVNRLDDLAMIDKDNKTVVIVDREGKPLVKIAAKGAGYQFDEPVDLEFDQLGHLYVLDRGRQSVFVFAPRGRLITAFTLPEKAPGAFSRARALAVDAAGRLYIFDERAKRIQVYQ